MLWPWRPGGGSAIVPVISILGRAALEGDSGYACGALEESGGGGGGGGGGHHSGCKGAHDVPGRPPQQSPAALRSTDRQTSASQSLTDSSEGVSVPCRGSQCQPNTQHAAAQGADP